MKRLSLILSIVLLSFTLTACPAIKTTALEVVNAVGRVSDGTELKLTPTGITFTPVGSKMSVVIAVIGEQLATSDSRCQIESEPYQTDNGVPQYEGFCDLGTLEAETVIALTGVNRATQASWLEEGELFAKYLVVTEKK